MASSAQDFFPMEGEAKVSENKMPGTAGPGELATAIEPAWFMPEKILLVPIDELVPYARNARTHSDAQLAQLRASIREFGFVNPVLIDSDRNIIAGRGRILAAKDEGMRNVPCVLIEHLTDTQRRAYILADNRLAELAGWDMSLVAAELSELQDAGFDLDITGFCPDDLQMEPVEVTQDEVPDAVEPRTKRGQVWRLGVHRLMCGDCTDKTAVERLVDGGTPTCIVTDPPYCSGGFQESGRGEGSIGTRDNIMIANDTLSTRGYAALIKSMLQNVWDAGIAYIFTDWRMFGTLFDCAESSGYGVRNMIVWDKGAPGLGCGWRAQHEICLMASRTKHKFNRHKAQGNVITCPRSGNVNHPTEKPVDLIAKIIDVTDFCSEIFDPFGGSGTTLIACEQLGRRCYMMELEAHWCDVIIARWERLTGKKAELLEEE
ncbi:site-specific DNA-methyltransferase [Agathobaculum sp. NTUH-O15-33]|uniref:site-specific DNA-methyltransferase n=1 Tax=Agathobaculum sp. NTUH-O15-33 TaxID=3079302 RepID=UPI00295887DB|nr:site-specific DNA-methyltransferase [Agathobaculum sp. NTUH-O15-33]WNX85775.1 site-specific DNA-methyltransferase [Agathobaculum sp. NTUH-O15-33]